MKKKFEISRTLKLKRIIYKYTGIFLAYKEENEYIDSDEFWKSLTKSAKHPKNDLSLRNIAGIQIGMWQAQHGFARPCSDLRFRSWRGRFRFFWAIVAWFNTLYLVIKWDLQDLFRRKK